MTPYEGEDSYFLSSVLKNYLKSKNKHIKILDMGTGAGIQAKTCKKQGFKNILCIDINEEVIKNMRKEGFHIIQSDLFSNINKSEKFNLIIFNPPYLPVNKYDKEKDTSGGKKGDETVLNFLNKVKPHLTEDGKILLLLSSYTPKLRINKLIKKLNLKKKRLSETKLFFESLIIYIISS